VARSERGCRRVGAAAVFGVSSILLAPAASAQQAPAAARPVAPPAAAAPVTAVPATAAPAPVEPVYDPPYEPSQHGGLPEGAWLRATRGTAKRSTGMMGTGIGMIGLGATLMAAGTAVYAGDNGCQGFNNSCNNGHGTGMAVLMSGLIALGLGIPLTIYGATEVPRAESGSARVVLPITVGVMPGGAAVSLRF
jgi:hypothetical protein